MFNLKIFRKNLHSFINILIFLFLSAHSFAQTSENYRVVYRSFPLMLKKAGFDDIQMITTGEITPVLIRRAPQFDPENKNQGLAVEVVYPKSRFQNSQQPDGRRNIFYVTGLNFKNGTREVTETDLVNFITYAPKDENTLEVRQYCEQIIGHAALPQRKMNGVELLQNEEGPEEIKNLKIKMNEIRKKIWSILTQEELNILTRRIFNDEMPEEELLKIRDKVYSALYRELTLEERNLVAMTWTSFQEVRNKYGRDQADDVKGRAQMLSVMAVIENRKQAKSHEDPQPELLDITLQNAQFSGFNYNDLGWVKTVLGPLVSIDGEVKKIDSENAFDRSLFAYRDFNNQRFQASPKLDAPKTAHFHGSSVERKNWGEYLDPRDLWVFVPPPPPQGSKVAVDNGHSFIFGGRWAFIPNAWGEERK